MFRCEYEDPSLSIRSTFTFVWGFQSPYLWFPNELHIIVKRRILDLYLGLHQYLKATSMKGGSKTCRVFPATVKVLTWATSYGYRKLRDIGYHKFIVNFGRQHSIGVPPKGTTWFPLDTKVSPGQIAEQRSSQSTWSLIPHILVARRPVANNI